MSEKALNLTLGACVLVGISAGCATFVLYDMIAGICVGAAVASGLFVTAVTR